MQSTCLVKRLIVSIYRAPAFKHPFQYSLMKPPSDTWLEARSLGAQQHWVLLDTTPNILQFNPVYNNNNNNNNNNELAYLIMHKVYWANFQNTVKMCKYDVFCN